MSEQPKPAPKAIELRIENLSQLFQTLDPFPFREKDLDKDVEEFIVSWAKEMPEDQPLKIVLHLPAAEAAKPGAKELDAALRRYFDYRAQATSRDLRELFRIGRRALAIGAAVLSFSVILSQTAAAYFRPLPIGRFIEESLTLFGWVANWRPIEIFLYAWWPVVRLRNLYKRLSEGHVELRAYSN